MSRLEVRKTHKLFIGGEFPRSESGRVLVATDADGVVLARVARASRKDLRDAVESARAAQPGWAGRTAYNRGQVLYRVAEMVEDRRSTFVRLLAADGRGAADLEGEVDAAVDRIVWYAGWADKFAQVVGNVNPVAGPYFNLSTPEPTGVVGVVAPEVPPLLGLVSTLAPVIVPGNTAVVVASGRWPLTAVAFTEALATADLPGGVVNVLTGGADELVPFLASHLGVDGLDLTGADRSLVLDAARAAAGNVKRLLVDPPDDWWTAQSPYRILAFSEIKTVWHPKGT